MRKAEIEFTAQKRYMKKERKKRLREAVVTSTTK
jgi:hypothetical protein